MRDLFLFLFLLSAFSVPMAFAEEDGNVCPEYSAPSCLASERLDISKDDNGCNIAKCVTSESMRVEEGFQAICPAFEKVPCSGRERSSSITDANGCRVATCVKIPE